MNIPMDIGFNFDSSKSSSNSLLNSKGSNTNSSSGFDSLLSNILESSTKNSDRNLDIKDTISNDELNSKDLTKEISSIIEELISIKGEDTLDNKDKTFNEDISFLQSITPLLLIDYNNMTNNKEYYSDNVVELLSNLSNNLSINELSNIKDIVSDFTKTLDSDFLDKLRSTENIELKKELLLNKLNGFTNINKFEVLNNSNNSNALNIENNLLNQFEVLNNSNNSNALNIENNLLNQNESINNIVNNNQLLDMIDTKESKDLLNINNTDLTSIDIKSKDILNNSKNINTKDLIPNTIFSKNLLKSVKENSIDANGFYNTFKTMKNNLINDKKNIDLNEMDTIEAINILSTNASQDSNNTENIAKFNVESNNFLLNEQSLPEDLYTTITIMKNNNLKQLKLKLSPKELGEMTIDISQLDNLSKITLTISNQDTLNIVKSNLKDILEHLKSNGLISSESSITVTTDSSSKESFSNFNQSYSSEEENRHNKNNRNSNIKLSSINDVSNDLVDSNVVKTDSNSLNILA